MLPSSYLHPLLVYPYFQNQNRSTIAVWFISKRNNRLRLTLHLQLGFLNPSISILIVLRLKNVQLQLCRMKMACPNRLAFANNP